MKAFLLSKEDIEMSKTEVLALYKPEQHELVDDLLLFETNKDYTNRLALTKKVYELITYDLNSDIDWKKHVSGSFKVVSTKEIEKKVASKIWNSVEDPKVDLENPDTEIHILNEKYVCKLIKNIPTTWKTRKPHLKPEMSPTSLNPRIAMAMVNLAGKPLGAICDPFSGTGGIMVEAGLLGHKTTGYDIDEITLRKAKLNLDHYNIQNYELKNQDALLTTQKFDFVVTDLPYGKNTKLSQELEKLYIEFFEKYKTVTDTMVIGLEKNNYDEKLFSGWEIKNEFEIYLHKNMSKKILVLSLN